MRLQRGVPVAGVEPELARRLARACHDDWNCADFVSHQVKMAPEEVVPLLDQLVADGYLERREAHRSDGALAEWRTTLSGGGLTMASFLKPISRRKAEELLTEVLDRAADYNANDDKPYVITEIAAFGSYIRRDEAELGDLDLTVKYSTRRPEYDTPERLLAFTRASGRSSLSFIDRLLWPREDLLRTLRARSGYISLHTEDVTAFTDQVQVLYRCDVATPNLD